MLTSPMVSSWTTCVISSKLLLLRICFSTLVSTTSYSLEKVYISIGFQPYFFIARKYTLHITIMNDFYQFIMVSKSVNWLWVIKFITFHDLKFTFHLQTMDQIKICNMVNINITLILDFFIYIIFFFSENTQKKQ